MLVGTLFAREVVTAGPRDSLAELAQRMEAHNVGTVVVVEGRAPVGIVTDRDLALAPGARGVPSRAPVEDVMSSPVAAIDHDQDVLSATRFMMNYEVRRLPIVDEHGELVGIVTLDDLLRVLGRQLNNLVEGIEVEMQVR